MQSDLDDKRVNAALFSLIFASVFFGWWQHSWQAGIFIFHLMFFFGMVQRLYRGES